MTFILDMIKLGLGNLRRHKLRSFLTALGIIFGVAAVITMVAIGEGSKQQALARYEQLGAKNIIVRSQRPPESNQMSGGQQRGRSMRYGLTRDDLTVLTENFPAAEAIVPLKEVGSQVLRQNLRQTSQTFGTTPDLLRVASLRVARGRYLNQADLDGSEMVAVIGSEVARQMFPFEDPLGNTLRIDQKSVKVIGVLAPVGLAGGAGAALVGRDLNLDVQIPLTTAQSVFGDQVFRRTAGTFQASQVPISEIYIASGSSENVLPFAALVRRIMEVRHAAQADVAIVVPYELIESAKRDAMTWQIVLGLIAGISLLVGGIGIMNIMLASVTERTREIGIRRALGATRRHITAQFLIETGVLSFAGGAIGAALGVGFSFGLNALWPYIREQFHTNIELATKLAGWSIILAFAVATFIGLVFGLYPAIKASKQDPIVALRHD